LVDALLSALEFLIIRKADGEIQSAHAPASCFQPITPPPPALSEQLLVRLAVSRELFRNHLVRYFMTFEPALSASQPLYIALDAFDCIFKTWVMQNGI
jgi:hypothetical protein